jgi:transposase InsO family protein
VDVFSVSSLDSRQRDLQTWPQVDDQAIRDPQKRALFINRSKAIRLLLEQASAEQITAQSGTTRREAMRLLRRCLTVSTDGQIFGFRALIPGIRIAKYTRQAKPRPLSYQKPTGSAGIFEQLLRSHTVLADLIQDQVFRLSKRNRIYESRIPIKGLHKRFIEKCRELGLEKDHQYPFSTRSLAYMSLSRYVRHLLWASPRKGASGMLGLDVAKKLRSGDGSNRPVAKVFERVECDAHHIDAIFCIQIPSIFGELIPKVVPRLWVIVIQEVLSKAILGYHLSMREECNSDDVLLAIQHALSKWEPRILSIPNLAYGTNSGFPVSQDPRFLGACWDEFSVDGALANQSSRVADKLERVVGAKPIVLPRRIPDDRPFIERFFGVLEEGGFHRLPNTTGNSPRDPRRNKPDEAALRYTIQIEQLEDLMDVLIANYNGTPHSSNGYRTPLEYLSYLSETQQNWPRQADPTEVNRLLNLTKAVQVHGGVHTGRRPYIHYLGANYSSDALILASNLVGKRISIEINVRDLRTVHAYGPTGAEIGVLRASPPWNRTPHSREMRQAVNSLVDRKMLSYLAQDDPVMSLLEHLETLALKGKAVPSLYLEARRLLTENIRELSESTSIPRPDNAIAAIPPDPLPQGSAAQGRAGGFPPSRKAING